MQHFFRCPSPEAPAAHAARPFAIYADEKLVGFCMFACDPEKEDADDRDWLRRFMIDRNEQGKGCSQAALQEIGFTMQG